MSARDAIRAIVAEQLIGLRTLSSAGALSQEELDRLETLAKIAVTADRVEPEADLDDRRSDAELERAATR